ncbi:MAG TPA: methylmalonyl Co-A mutase-associated GTPase MeaB [Cytophagales bacterium]|nr:methylmalonyl Co-A mutase-associated GTPase MeaB [Cytophagales bacterium]
MKNTKLSVNDISQKLLAGDVVALSRAITLIESKKNTDQKLADRLLKKIVPHTGHSLRIGITGSPGVGKSTFIEAFGKHITSLGKKVAVLAIDPSSAKTKGSILGDRTRMEELSKDAKAFIRPTATGTSLGGVADKTRETILLCEAAGFEIIIVETVGVGQSETAVRNMVDFFLLLQLAGAGDELQGIKKGIMEMADAIVITKADGENEKKAKQAQTEFFQALHLFQPSTSAWQPKVLTTSALQKKGIEEVWKMIQSFQLHTAKNGFFNKNREQQKLEWFHESIQLQLKERFFKSKKEVAKMKSLEKKIVNGEMIPSKAAEEFVLSSIRKR